MTTQAWIECSDRLPPVGAKVEAMDRDGEIETVTVRRDHTGRWADPGHSCAIRYFDKDDHLPRWRLVEPQPDTPAARYPAITAMLDLEINHLQNLLETVIAERGAMDGPMKATTLLEGVGRATQTALRRFDAANGSEVDIAEFSAVHKERGAIGALLRGKS